MSLEKLNEAPGRSVESIDRKEYKETIEQKRRIRELIPYLKDDPNKVLAEEFWGKKNMKESRNNSWEAVKWIWYEKNPWFTRKWRLWETQRVEYVWNRLESTIHFNNEVLKINISNFEKHENQDPQNWERETPMDVDWSGNMSPENMGKLLENLKISTHKEVLQSWLSKENCIKIVEKMVDSRKQDYHWILSNKEKQENIRQKEQQADLQLFLAIISMDAKGWVHNKTELLQNYIKQEVNPEKMSFKHELQLCSALVILWRSMSAQELMNKFDTENKSWDKVWNVSDWSKDEDILEYVANNPWYFVQHSQEIIDEAKKHIVPYNDEFTNILQS